MSDTATDVPKRRTIRLREVDWRRIGELAARQGIECAELVRRAVSEYEDRHRREPLPIAARARPLSTGELILAHILVEYGDEMRARVAMRATVEEWTEAIGSIPGLRAEIERKRGMIHG